MANAIVVVGASRGGLSPLRRITKSLPHTCKATLFVVVHVGEIPNSLPEILSWNGRLPVSFGAEGTLIEAGHIYVAPSDRHMLVTAHDIRLIRRLGPFHTSCHRSSVQVCGCCLPRTCDWRCLER